MSLSTIVILIHSDRNEIRVAEQDDARHRLFFSFGSTAHAPIIIKEVIPHLSSLIFCFPSAIAIQFLYAWKAYTRSCTENVLCIDSKKDVDTRRARVRWGV